MCKHNIDDVNIYEVFEKILITKASYEDIIETVNELESIFNNGMSKWGKSIEAVKVLLSNCKGIDSQIILHCDLDKSQRERIIKINKKYN